MNYVSVIVPIYNIEGYISKCIDSILSQTYEDWELILVDDGSTDSSGKICDEYALKDARIKVIHKKNEGLVEARKTGVSVAQGTFLYHLDGDDFIANDTIELLINKQKETNADVVKAQHVCSDKFGNKQKEFKILEVPEVVVGRDEWLEFILNGSWNIWNNLIRASIYKDNVNVPLYAIVGEDLITTLQLALGVNKVAMLGAVTYFYVQRDSSIIGSIINDKLEKAHKHITLLSEIDKVLTIYQERNISSLILTKINNRILFTLFKEILFYIHINEDNKIELKRLYIKYYAKNFKNRWQTFCASPIRYFKCWYVGLKFL